MPLSLLICGSDGVPFYSWISTEEKMDPTLLSGLISALDSIGNNLFSKRIATVMFGDEDFSSLNQAVSRLVVIPKDLFIQDKHINFVFYMTGDYPMRKLREIVTQIFMEVKPNFRQATPNLVQIKSVLDRLIEVKYNGFVDL